jgi:hypothetical protein
LSEFQRTQAFLESEDWTRNETLLDLGAPRLFGPGALINLDLQRP